MTSFAVDVLSMPDAIEDHVLFERASNLTGPACRKPPFEVVPKINGFPCSILFGGYAEAFSELRVDLFEHVVKITGRDEDCRRSSTSCEDKARFPLTHSSLLINLIHLSFYGNKVKLWESVAEGGRKSSW